MRGGEPLLCTDETLRTTGGIHPKAKMAARVEGGREVAVGMRLTFNTAGIWGQCAPLVAFLPEAGARYVVITEVVGGKGRSVLWTGLAMQRCRVTIFRETDARMDEIETRPVSEEVCAAPHIPRGERPRVGS